MENCHVNGMEAATSNKNDRICDRILCFIFDMNLP